MSCDKLYGSGKHDRRDGLRLKVEQTGLNSERTGEYAPGDHGNTQGQDDQCAL